MAKKTLKYNPQNTKQTAKYRDVFTRSGLSEREAVVYEALLNSGAIKAQDLQKITPYSRTNLYNILDLLVEKGLVEQETESIVSRFKPADPHKLSSFVYDQKMRYNEADSLLSSVMPGISELYKMTTERPVVRVYEGLEGIKEIYLDTLRENNPISAFLTPTESDPRVWKWLRKNYIKQRIEAGIHARVIVSRQKIDQRADEYTEDDTSELRQTKIVDHSLFPCNLEVQIYGNKVSFANYNKNDPLFGVIIDNQHIATSMLGMFELAWVSNPST